MSDPSIPIMESEVVLGQLPTEAFEEEKTIPHTTLEERSFSVNVYQAAIINKLLASLGVRAEQFDIVKKRSTNPKKSKKRPLP
jgi:hypothetical protein